MQTVGITTCVWCSTLWYTCSAWMARALLTTRTPFKGIYLITLWSLSSYHVDMCPLYHKDSYGTRHTGCSTKRILNFIFVNIPHSHLGKWVDPSAPHFLG